MINNNHKTSCNYLSCSQHIDHCNTQHFSIQGNFQPSYQNNLIHPHFRSIHKSSCNCPSCNQRIGRYRTQRLSIQSNFHFSCLYNFHPQSIHRCNVHKSFYNYPSCSQRIDHCSTPRFSIQCNFHFSCPHNFHLQWIHHRCNVHKSFYNFPSCNQRIDHCSTPRFSTQHNFQPSCRYNFLHLLSHLPLKSISIDGLVSKSKFNMKEKLTAAVHYLECLLVRRSKPISISYVTCLKCVFILKTDKSIMGTYL